MNLGVPCNCARQTSSYRYRYSFPHFVQVIDGDIVGIRIPESVKKDYALYYAAIQEFRDWFYYDCPHYGHFRKFISYYSVMDSLTNALHFIAPRQTIPLLYMILIDSYKTTTHYEPKVYIPYNRLNDLIEEINYCKKLLNQVRIPCLYRMEPFKYIWPFENLYKHRDVLFTYAFATMLHDTIMFSLPDAYALPGNLFNDYKHILAQRPPFKYTGEKALITRHFFTLKLKDTPDWLRIIDMPTGRFIDLPRNIGVFIQSLEDFDNMVPCVEFKIILRPVIEKDFFIREFDKLMPIIEFAKKYSRPLIGIDKEMRFSSLDKLFGNTSK